MLRGEIHVSFGFVSGALGLAAAGALTKLPAPYFELPDHPTDPVAGLSPLC